MFGEKLTQVNTSNHYTAQPLTPERVDALDREKMIAFYRERFANAADFTFFMVGAFKVDEVAAAAGAVCRIAAVDRQADLDLQGRRAALPGRRRSRRRSSWGASRAARR